MRFESTYDGDATYSNMPASFVYGVLTLMRGEGM